MKSVNSALLWRLGVIALIPVLVVFVVPVVRSITHRLYPESAAGLRFGIRLDRLNDETCLVFRSDPAPEDLRAFLCPD